jgi:hypothetical protein
MSTQITEKDPHTGKECTLNELAQLYQLTKATIYRRWRLGKRGIDLVAPAKEEQGRRNLSTAELHRMAKKERAHFIKMAKQSMLAKPMNQIADANKKGMQA